MKKEIVVYRENKRGEIAKFINGVEVVDGVVVNEGNEGGGFWSNLWKNWTGAVGGGSVENSYVTTDNGRHYDHTTGRMEYTRGAGKRPTHLDQTIISDGTGVYGDDRATG